jgi:hypothetical protein
MSAFLPVISTRFPAVNHGLHIKDKRVFSVYYLWAVKIVNIFNSLTQIDNAHMLVKVFNNSWRKLPFSDRFSHAGVSWIS